MAHRVAHKIPLPAKPAWPAPPDESLEDVLRERWDRLGHTRELVRNPAPPACEPGRWDVPEQLPGTGMISGYPELDGAETIVRLLRATPWLYRPLRDAVAGAGEGQTRAEADGWMRGVRLLRVGGLA